MNLITSDIVTILCICYNVMMKPIKRVAVLHDIVGVGKSGMTNILPILSYLGIEACPIPTMLFSTHTGYRNPAICVAENYIPKVLKHYIELGIYFDAILVGYMGNLDILSDVKEFIKYYKEKFKTKVIIDPIFADNGKLYSNIAEEYVVGLREIIKYADILLPNLTEAKLISNCENLEEICERLKVEEVIITGIETEDKKVDIYLYKDGKGTHYIYDKYYKNMHGTGDIFTGLITGLYLSGVGQEQAIRYSHFFIYECIKKSMEYDYKKEEGILLESNLYILNDLMKGAYINE